MIKETEVMEKFLNSFANEGWSVDDKGRLMLKSEDKKSEFAYVDYGNFSKEVSVREINLRLNDDLYRLMEYPLENGPVYILVMPSPDREFAVQEEMGQGTFYNADGELNRYGYLIDLPSKIDMKKTVELFLKQVIEKDFSKPVLVRPEK